MNEIPQIPRYLPNGQPLFYIDRLIAEGGTAKVYWGVDNRNGYAVAIKELKARSFENPAIRDKFKKVEAQMYTYLQHPNIPKLVQFIDVQEREQMYIVMDFIEGRSLEDYIYKEIGLIPEQKALPLFLKILDTIAYIHNTPLPGSKNGTLHLDIKSNNVMLQPDGKIKIIDLGIASRMNDLFKSDSNRGYGTPAYMPSEQSEKQPCGKYTDVFALGIVLFEMLTGRVPFNGQSIEEIRYKIKYEPTPQMNQFYPHIHPDLQIIVERALAKNPADRYQSCEEFRNFIMDFMHKQKIKH